MSGGTIWHVGFPPGERDETDGATCSDVVERRQTCVQEEVSHPGDRIDLSLARVLRLDFAFEFTRHVHEGDVRAAPFGGSHGLASGRAEHQLDPVGIAVWPGGLRPLLEARIADEPDLFGADAVDDVRTGRRQGVRFEHVRGSTGRDDKCQRPRELVQEVGVGCAQMERDGSGAVVRDDPTREVASARPFRALVSPDNRAVVRGCAQNDEEPLERAFEVRGTDEAAVRVRNAGAQAKCVRAAAVGGRRDRDRQIWN
jgi:hypothetical protein